MGVGGGRVGGGGLGDGGVGDGGVMVVEWVVVGWVIVGWVVVGGVIRLSFQSNSNSQKLSLWCKKINHYPLKWICMTHIWFPTEFPRGIIIFQGVLTKSNL